MNDYLTEFTKWDHTITFDPKGLAYFYGGLVLSVGLLIMLYFLVKAKSG